MVPIRHVNRRSFLSQVVGGVFAGGGLLALVSGEAGAQPRRQRMTVDADPTDPARTGISDSDSGGNADPPEDGRGGPEARRRGVADTDSGANADPARRGRGPPHTRPPPARGSDSDPSDLPGWGRSARTLPPPPGPPPLGGVRGPASPGRFVICPGHRRCPRS